MAGLFLEPIWLYALLLLILFILIYLIRSKPEQRVIPSIMFLFKDLGRDKKTNFFRRLLRDLLFLLQLIILLLLIIGMAKPYINVSKESLFKNTVLVVDASASMKAAYGGGTRFDEAVSLAKKNTGSVNTLIIAKDIPEVVLEQESSGQVIDYLKGMEPSDTASNLYDAISAAGGYAQSDSRIVVISDFIDTETDTSLDSAKRTLEAQGIKVDFIRVYEPASNIGIVDLDVDEEKSVVVIKNFGQEAADVKLEVGNVEETLSIPSGSKELFSFSTPKGSSEIKLVVKDGFEPDNTAYISTPSETQKKVLLITNNAAPEKTYVFNAFDVMKNNVIDVAAPPKVPNMEPYDVYIFKDIDPSLILPGTYKNAKKQVEEQGKTSIVMAQTKPASMLSLSYQGLMPLSYNQTLEDMVNIGGSGAEELTSNIKFGITNKYFRTAPLKGLSTVVIAAADDTYQTPVISYSPLGDGKLFFYGILDEDKNADTVFAKSPSYFVFWKRLSDFATDTPSLSNLNYRTGNVLSFSEEKKVKTPTEKVTTDRLRLENAGLYTLNDRVIAINLLNEKESDVNAAPSLGDERGAFEESERFQEKVAFELTSYLVIAAILLLLIEFLYIKLRGDL